MHGEVIRSTPLRGSNIAQRHDNDRKFPRTPSEIFELNKAVASKMQNVFSSRGIPVVPSLGASYIHLSSPVLMVVPQGNNDVWRKSPFLSLQLLTNSLKFLAHVITSLIDRDLLLTFSLWLLVEHSIPRYALLSLYISSFSHFNIIGPNSITNEFAL